MLRRCLPVILITAIGVPAKAQDSLGVFSQWGAFREPSVPRCYAISEADPSNLARDYQPYTTVASWPARRVSGQVHFRLSRARRTGSQVSLRIGRERFILMAGKADAWGRDAAMDYAIVAAMRKADTMTIYATDARGRRFSNTYRLSGAATAIDAAKLACSRR